MTHNFEKKSENKTAAKIPDTLVPCRPGDKLLIVIPHYWGKGASIAEAKEQLVKQCGKITGFDAPRCWRVYSVDPGTAIGDMGGMIFPKDARPALLIASTLWPVE